MASLRTALAGLLGVMLVTSCMLPTQVEKSSGDETASATSIAYSGIVLGLDGKPASGISVRGHLISNNGSTLIGIYGSKYRVQASELETRTDSQGRFTLREFSGQPLNIEAVLSDEVKAIQLNVASSTTDVTLQLAYTGSISGKVTAPSAPGVTNFEGVDVFIPGTSYIAKTTSAGRYVLSNVAAGTFSLVGSKVGLGRGNLHGVKVEPKKTTDAADLELSVAAPVISSISPASGGRGTTVVIQGQKFGASTGEPFQVVFGGSTATAPTRLDDGRIQVVVPSSATSGDVVVTVAGIPSNLGAFTVLDSLFIGPNLRYLGDDKTQKYLAWAKDSAGRTLENPGVEWSANGPVAVNSGNVTGSGLGAATLQAKSGSLTATLGIEVVSGTDGTVNTVAGSKDAAFKDDWGPSASFNYPHGVALDQAGNLYVADRLNHRIRLITPDGRVSTYAGTGDAGRLNGSRLNASFSSPKDLVFDKDGNLYVSEDHAIRKITPGGEVSTLAGFFWDWPGYTDHDDGSLAAFNSPHGLALGPDDHLYVADYDNHAIRKVSLTGAVTTLAGSGNPGFTEGTGKAAQFKFPTDVAVDAQGNVYVADKENHRIRLITKEGVVSTYAGTASYGWNNGGRQEAIFYHPHGLAFDAQGNLFVTEQSNHEIRRIDVTGNVTTVAGNGSHEPTSLGFRRFKDGPARDVTFDQPFGICIDASGRLFVGDRINNRIRVFTP